MERNYKLYAHNLYTELFGNGLLEELLCAINAKEMSKRFIRVLTSTKNLIPSWQIRDSVVELLSDYTHAMQYGLCLSALMTSSVLDSESFGKYAAYMKSIPKDSRKRSLSTWTFSTIFPFIAQPNTHILLKTLQASIAADRMSFELNYSSVVNWKTYSSYLNMARIYFEQLSELRPRDFIDIQSFFWVIGNDKYSIKK